MLPSVIPKAGSMQVEHRHTFRLHHNCEIDTSRFEEGSRPPHRRDLRPDEALACCVDTARLAGVWTGGSSHVVGRRSRRQGNLTIPWLVRPLVGSVKGLATARRVLDRHRRRARRRRQRDARRRTLAGQDLINLIQKKFVWSAVARLAMALFGLVDCVLRCPLVGAEQTLPP